MDWTIPQQPRRLLLLGGDDGDRQTAGGLPLLMRSFCAHLRAVPLASRIVRILLVSTGFTMIRLANRHNQVELIDSTPPASH